MVDHLLLLALTGSAAIVAVLVVRQLRGQQTAATLVTFRLDFPRDVETAAVVAFLGRMAGLLPPWHRRLFGVPVIAFEVAASAGRITHYLSVPSGRVEFVLGQLHSALPGVRAVVHEGHPPVRPTLARELRLTSLDRPLRTDAAAISAGLLASLQPLHRGEQAVMQWLIAPTAPVAPAGRDSRAASIMAKLMAGDQPKAVRLDRNALRAARAKRAEPLLLAAGRLGVVASTPGRAGAVMARLIGALHATSAPGVRLRRRLVPSSWVARCMEKQAVPAFGFTTVLNAAELAAAVAWPIGSPAVAGLEFKAARQLAPSEAIPRQGRVLADANFAGAERPLALAVTDSLKHLWICGPTGVGKSTLLTNLIVQDLESGRAVVVVDPKGDLVAEVLERVPAGREADVVLLDPADDQRPVGMNLLAGAEANPELVVDQLLGVLHRLYAAFWGPRTQDVLHAGLLTLVTEPGMTLVELPLLLTNEGFRRRLVGRLDDPIALGPFWAAYNAMSAGERAQAIGPVMNKLRQFLLRPRLRAIIGQAEPTFTLSEVLEQRKVLLVSLAAGVVGDEAAALIGALVVARLWQAIQARAGRPCTGRAPAFVFLDEFQSFVRLPTDLTGVLAQARGLGVGFTLAHQHLGQLPPELRQAVLANARSKVVFQTGAADAAAVAREFGPLVAPADLQGLGAYEVMVQLVAGAEVAPPATGTTRELPPPSGLGERARQLSQLQYGRDRAEVEAAIRRRQAEPAGTGSVTRRARGGGGALDSEERTR